jgi:hypothetical protein
MAVKYVSEFSFPSQFGFSKSNGGHKGDAKGMSSFAKSKAGPSVVTGNSRGTGGGKHTTGAVPKFAKGGHASTPQRYADGGWSKNKGVSLDSGMGAAKREKYDNNEGAGIGAPKYARINDKKSPPATRGEKSSGVQKPAFKSGGHATTPDRYKGGGMIKTAAGKVKDGAKTPWNKDDGTSPGSFKRTPPKQSMKNKAAAYDKFDAEGRDTDPATEQNGNVERMSEFSDFKRGGHAKKYAKGGHASGCGCKMCSGGSSRYAKGGQVTTEDRYETESEMHGERHIPAPDKQVKGDGMEYKKGGRIGNLKHYAHPSKKAAGGAAGTRTERPSGHASSMGKMVNESPKGSDERYERAAGTPGETPEGDYHETKSGEPMMSGGGFNRGANPKKMAAIHAKKDHAAMGALAQVAAGLEGGAPQGPPHQPAAPGMGPAPPGMAPQMGAPPGMAGGVRPMPPMAGGPPMANSGGSVQHIVHHHVMH